MVDKYKCSFYGIEERKGMVGVAMGTADTHIGSIAINSQSWLIVVCCIAMAHCCMMAR